MKQFLLDVCPTFNKFTRRSGVIDIQVDFVIKVLCQGQTKFHVTVNSVCY